MKNNKGFSLVELIVVIAIMAILAAVAVVSFSIYIEKAHESNDHQYMSNVKYFAQLSATEHQLEILGVHVEKIVDGPEDIKLLVKDSKMGNTVIYTYESGDAALDKIILEIYQGVGDWEFYKEVPNEELPEGEEPEYTEPTLPPSATCEHANKSTEVLKAPTCDQDGKIRTKCLNPQCGQISEEILNRLGHNYTPYNAGGGFLVEYCDKCGGYKITGPDNMPLVPMG